MAVVGGGLLQLGRRKRRGGLAQSSGRPHPASGRWGPLARLVLAALAASAVVAEADDEGESKSSDILEVMAWCKDVEDSLDWGQVLRLAKTECRYDAEDDEALRIRCSDHGLTAVLDGTRMVLEMASERVFACANGLIFLLSVALAYGRQGRDALSPREVARAQVLLWQALQENFMLDASIWPVKTFDVLRLFDKSPAALQFSDERRDFEASDITVLVPRCPPDLAVEIASRFPGVRVVAGMDGEFPGGGDAWTIFDDAWDKPTGVMLNRMLESIDTPFVFVVIGSAIPESLRDLERLAVVLQSRRLVVAAGPVVSESRVFMDFCYQLRPRHYQLHFDSVYQHSVIFDESSAASIRGSWFHEDKAASKDGPCKVCETIPPTFMARSDLLRAIGFHPALDGEFALLDFALRSRRAPLVQLRPVDDGGPEELRRFGQSPLRDMPGLSHVAPAFASCPHVVSRELPGLASAHLYGRSDMPASGVSSAEPWFLDDASGLGPAMGPRATAPAVLRPSTQAAMFMEVNNLKYFTGPDGVTRRFGCNLAKMNCPVPQWVFRGWAVPPCCKETMRHLLFYIDDVFRDMGVRYIVTDGVLLGSYKYGTMLDWDADVDLHIHDDDFHRLESEVQHRVRDDGHYLRKHSNNASWLLQANDHNYLLIELNLRKEHWDPEHVWQLPINGRLFPAMENAHVNISTWYGLSFFRHRLRHVPEWEEKHRPMFCCTPYHYNCVDEAQVPSGKDCRHMGIC